MKTIYLNTTDLTRDKRITYTSEDVVSSASTIAVQSVVGFESLSTSSGQVICIGKIGSERTEIVRTSNSTGPSSAYKWIYLRDTLQFDHPQDTPVSIIDWDRAELQWAQTVRGTKATLFAYPSNITPDLLEMLMVDTSASAGFYFTRFNNTINGMNSDWSDAIPFSGYDDNMVFSIKKRALDEMGEVIDGNIITHEFLNQSLWEARRDYHQAAGKRPFRRKYNVSIGFALTGSYRVEVPTDLEAPYGEENVYGVRVGSNPNMTYYGKKEFDFDYRNKNHSTLELPYVYGLSTSIWLANGRDFSDSAVIQVEGLNIGASRITGEANSFYIYQHPTGGYSASGGSDAFENQTFGLPDKFTVWADPGGSAYVYFNRPFETAYVNENIYMDYYTKLPGYDSDADTLDEPKYDMFVYWLKYKIRGRKLKGDIPVVRNARTGQVFIADADYQTYLQKRAENLASEFLSVELRMKPEIEHLRLPSEYGN